jgi:FkbH-like protein
MEMLVNNSPVTDVAAVLARSIEKNSSLLIDIWESLAAIGFRQGESWDSKPFIRKRYLLPLTRLLIGALRGSATHRAIYFDERTRYMSANESAAEHRAQLAKFLGVEMTKIAEAFATRDLPKSVIFDALSRLHAQVLDPPKGSATARLLFVGDCLFVETRAFLEQLLLDHNYNPEIAQVFFSSTQGQLSVDDVLATIERTPPDLIGISLYSFGALPLYVALMREADQLAPAELKAKVDYLADLLEEVIRKIRAVTEAPIVVHSPCGLPLNRVRRRAPFMAPLSSGQRQVIQLLREHIQNQSDMIENVIHVDESEIVDRNGGLRACSRTVFQRGDVPEAVFHTSLFGEVLADEYRQIVSAYVALGKAKALLVDFDNTLWAGVMAEGPVVHHEERQKLLKRLKDAGILLVALSKNDPASIRWDEMALTPDDFVLHKINWLPKPDNAAQVIAELDLAPAAFVLLDDNPVERALVSEQIPKIKSLDATLPATWRALDMWLRFPSTKQTEEARRRTEIYREAAERRRCMADSHDYPSMMKSLGLTLGFRLAKKADMDRLVELIQRTNQFNTTTKRRSVGEIIALLDSPAHAVYVGTLKDRFGALGVVGLAIAERQPDATIVIDSVIMSCRAMGFGFEQAFLRKVIDAEPAERYFGLFTPTERNSPASSLFSNFGFTRSENDCWALDKLTPRMEVPVWFAVEG